MALEQLLRKPRLAAIALAAGMTFAGIAKADPPAYGPPENVVSVNGSGTESDPEISCDGRRIYFAGTANAPNDLLQATRTGPDFVNIEPIPGVNTDANAEANPALTCDESEIIFTRWPIGSNPANSAALYHGVWDGAQFVVQPITSLDITNQFEGNASFFDNDLRIAFIRSCEGACDLSTRGIYEAIRPNLGSPDFTQARKWDEFDVFGEGKLGDVAVSRDGLRAIASCYQCTGRTDGWDLLYGERPDLNANFSNFQSLNLNSPITDFGASFGFDPTTLYFASDRTGGLGRSDIWRALAPPLCDSPQEVSASGRPPLLVSKDLSAITTSFEDFGSNCNVYNMYIGSLGQFSEAPFGFCRVLGTQDPADPVRRNISFPLGTRSEFYLVTTSTDSAEGTAGYASTGAERIIPRPCGTR